MQTYKDKTVAIIGLSVEGLDSVRFFHQQGARIWCCDFRSAEVLGSTYKELSSIAEGFQLGEDYLAHLERFDIVVRTAGMLLKTPQLVAYKEKGKDLTTLTKLFFTHCRAPIIGVTGTKGKGTTSTLIKQILQADGKTVWLGGNVGVPLLSQVEDIKETDLVVLELSSFQLEDLTQSPHIAVVLSTTQEHLVNQDRLATNYHESREAYVEAKKSIVKYQNQNDIAILNMDDPTSSSFAKETSAHVRYFSRRTIAADAYVQDHAVYLKHKDALLKVCASSDVKLRGEHNLENIAAAALAADLCGAKIESIVKATKAFEGLEHRLEVAGLVDKVLYINDSFSTVPETAIAAIESFTEPIVLIAGGSEKGSDFIELGKCIASHSVHTLIAIGDMTSRIVDAAVGAGYKGNIITGLSTMHDVVAGAKRTAKPGDVVLLSPACASFDMFANYKERGKQFKHEVSLL